MIILRECKILVFVDFLKNLAGMSLNLFYLRKGLK